MVVRRERLARHLLGRDHREVRDLLAYFVERSASLRLDIAASGGEQLLALLVSGGLRLVGERVGCAPRADDDLLGLLAGLPETGAVLLEQLVGLSLGPLGVVDRLLDGLPPPVERLRDAGEGELVEQVERRPERDQ